MRIGGAQELCLAGFELPMIMLAGRWSTVQTVKLYVRNIAVQHSAMARLQRMLLNGEHRLGPDARGADVMSCYNMIQVRSMVICAIVGTCSSCTRPTGGGAAVLQKSSGVVRLSCQQD